MEKYDPSKIESKWQRIWQAEKTFEPDLKKAEHPFYNLMMFPYPSGEGLHIGHFYAFSGADTFGRFKKMQGFDLFEPMGFDAFGIHSENYALTIGKHPRDLIQQTTARYREQLKRGGFAFAWSHEINTTAPQYYKWTQWLFLQLFKGGLAERKKAPVNWCPSCKTVLADEQVIGGYCERCEAKVEQRELEQWFLKITKYAERLWQNLEKIDWSENVKKLQRNWIGRSEGVKVKFEISNQKSRRSFTKFIEVFTTRIDTIFGATFLALAPEHEFSQAVGKVNIEVKKYLEKAKKKGEEERRERVKRGVFTGIYARNPASGKKIPIWVADFVLAHYGGGAIMGVPAHDQRDFEFAKKYNLPMREVILPEKRGLRGEEEKEDFDLKGEEKKFSSFKLKMAYEGEGILVNSGQFNGLSSEKARQEITKWLAEKKLARKAISYRLRDWLISRQRYWGPPIPIIYCRRCRRNSSGRRGRDYTIIDGKEYAIVPVPEKDLPVILPYVKEFRPTGTEKSPLANISQFVQTFCPRCGALAKRESDVSDNFLDSAWYFLRYPSSEFDDRPFDAKITKKWLPVEMYIGGPEHACLHLLYTRFITMALYDLGYLNFEEPFKSFRAHGHITKDGQKMSKSKGNVVVPDEYIEKYGADVLRMYLLFLGPFDQGGDFSDKGIVGIVRFLKKVWDIIQKVKSQKSKVKITNQKSKLLKKLHQTIKKVTEDIENLRFNTAIAALMAYLNELEKSKVYDLALTKPLILLLAPFAPHLSEELWQGIKNQNVKRVQFKSIFQESWPRYIQKLTEEGTITLIIQINGRVRDQIRVSRDLSERQAQELALQSSKIQKWLKDKEIKKIIFVPKKLINFVTN